MIYFFFLNYCTVKIIKKIKRESNPNSTLRVCFTAMHGVGAQWVALALKAFALPPYIGVREQLRPDPDFPTVAFPNPEEKGALVSFVYNTLLF